MPAALPLQAVHSSKSARRCLSRTGLRTRQPKGSRTTCSLGFEHRLTTCEPSRAPILDCGPNPSVRPGDSGPSSRLSLSCMASCRSRKTVRVAESGIENGPGKHGRTRPHPSFIQRRQDITAIPSPVPDPIPMPTSNFARLPRRSLPARGSPMEPSCHRLLVCSSPGLLVYTSAPVVYSSVTGLNVMEGTWGVGGSSPVQHRCRCSPPHCCAAWDTWDLEMCLVLGADLFFRSALARIRPMHTHLSRRPTHCAIDLASCSPRYPTSLDYSIPRLQR